jgi:hypothetical protein
MNQKTKTAKRAKPGPTVVKRIEEDCIDLTPEELQHLKETCPENLTEDGKLKLQVSI